MLLLAEGFKIRLSIFRIQETDIKEYSYWVKQDMKQHVSENLKCGSNTLVFHSLSTKIPVKNVSLLFLFLGNNERLFTQPGRIPGREERYLPFKSPLSSCENNKKIKSAPVTKIDD